MERSGIVSAPKRRHLTLEEYYWKEAVEIMEKSNIYYPRDIKRIEVQSNSGRRFSTTSLNLEIYPKLKKIYIHSECIRNCGEVIINGHEKLEIVDFGQYNFTIGDDKNARGLLRISSCPNLRNIVIGDGSFNTYKELILMDLNSLKELVFGKQSFYQANFIIKGKKLFRCVQYVTCRYANIREDNIR